MGVVPKQENGKSGFKSILKKSLYFSSMRYRECLMEIAMLCEENSMENFVDNLHDFTILISCLSPTIVNFFENSFNETRFTKKINNIDWQQRKTGSKIKVIGKQDSVITERKASALLNKNLNLEQRNELQSRPVHAKMLQIGWLYQNPQGEGQCGVRELIVALADVQMESLFDTELIKVIAEHFFDRYRSFIMLAVFIPWLVYFFMVIFYVSVFTVDGTANLSDGAKILETIMRWLITILAFYLEFFEVVCMVRDKWGYVDKFNIIDQLSLVLNFTCLYYPNGGDRTLIQRVAALTAILMWSKAFNWMRAFKKTGKYVRLLCVTIEDIGTFIILFLCILFAFADALLILNKHRPVEEAIYKDFFGIELIDPLMN